MSKKTTIYDIAKALDITAATVSRALNNNPKISDTTRELVLQKAAEMNYEQNKLAQALKSGKSYNVGVIVPRVDSNFFGSVIRGIEEELNPQGYHVIICQSYEDPKTEGKKIDTLLNAQVDGVLVSTTSNSKKEPLKRILAKNIPLIFFDRRKDMQGVSSVVINDFEGAYKATKHLIDEGCTKIAHLSGNFSLEIFRERFSGYKQAIIDAGLPFNEDWVIKTKSNRTDGIEATKTLLQLNPRPDAIFSASDFAALGAIQEIRAQKLNIPQDISVVGFSNEPFTKFMELPISTIDQSPFEMGKMAAKVFLEQSNNESHVKMEKKVVLDPQLIIRNSSLKTQVLTP
ncbi:LacI family transcriptional regulator [Tamlana nanhaiensis]|uniref:LacI family transcriptional regulator n=1 Tax=Neotamlana nanhaiensis TaxID=1382798 RepID=A0A0D7VZR6_9FLAO|nr:LacI family DNA-binding transcriptional regulator [Tamlana nanhaiensis]KJD31102.1 LacI family transcriptional regulator [Tamlana nanhaiensis]